MLDPTNYSQAKALLERYGLSPKKSFGQNFLINPRIPERIAETSAAGLPGNCAVIEIGPGIGALTSRLCDRFTEVIAIELDREMIKPLSEVLSDRDNVTVINHDIMKLDVDALIDEKLPNVPVAIAANLPYYITTPVIMKLLDVKKIQKITLMIQAEVADRLAASSGTAEYGAITVAVALRARIEKCFDVSPGNFLPQPKVTSTVISLYPHKNGIRDVFDDIDGDESTFLRDVGEVVSTAFSMRRKTLANTLSSRFGKEKVCAAITQLGFDASVRGERLSAVDFCRLTKLLKY